MKKTKLLPVSSVAHSSELPNLLMIKDGKLVTKDGSIPDFAEFPDGDVCVVGRKSLVKMLDFVHLFRSFGG